MALYSRGLTLHLRRPLLHCRRFTTLYPRRPLLHLRRPLLNLRRALTFLPLNCGGLAVHLLRVLTLALPTLHLLRVLTLTFLPLNRGCLTLHLLCIPALAFLPLHAVRTLEIHLLALTLPILHAWRLVQHLLCVLALKFASLRALRPLEIHLLALLSSPRATYHPFRVPIALWRRIAIVQMPRTVAGATTVPWVVRPAPYAVVANQFTPGAEVWPRALIVPVMIDDHHMAA